MQKTQKFFYNLLPAKKLALFAVLAVLALGFSFVFSKNACAAFKMTDTEKQQFSQMVKDDPTVSAGRKTDANIAELITSYEGRFNNFNEVKNEWGNPAAAQQIANSADVGGQVNVEGENLLIKTLLAVVIGVLSIIVYFLKYLVSWSGALVDLALNPSLYNFVNNDMIRQGWIVVRDICNLFFLLALLFIAICTILKIDKYHAKKTLLTLIIMALLINFSKPIAIFIFDGSQLLMNFFLTQINGNQQSASSIYTGAAKIADSVYKNIPNYFGTNLDSPSLALVYLFSTIFLFMLAVAYLVTAIFLIIRIVAVMLLIIVSPLAFFAAIIPDFSNMSTKWWKALFEYSYYGPAAAFFLLLATKLQSSLPNLGTINMGGDPGVTAIISNMVQYLIVIIFLYASIVMAKQFGGAAGAAVVGNANRMMKWAGGMTKGGGMWGSGARLAGSATGVSDIYKGIKSGYAKQPVLRMFTKEGREAKSKERQAKWEGKVAPFNIANIKKKSEEMKNDDITKINAGVAKGDAASILQAASRGKLTAAQLADPKVRAVMERYADFEGAVYKNLRDTGNGHVQWDDMHDRGATTTEAFDKTYKDMSFNNMAEKGNLKKALTTEDVPGSTYDIFHKMNKLKDTTTIKNLQARATDGDTFNVLQKLHDYRVWESSGWTAASRPTGFAGAPANLGDFSVYLKS